MSALFQEEELDETNVQVSPPGFHVIFLPFAEDLRKLHYEETPKGAWVFLASLLRPPTRPGYEGRTLASYPGLPHGLGTREGP